MRKWLNEDFYNDSFTGEEKDFIVNTSIDQDGERSQDKVFLIGKEDIEAYNLTAKPYWLAANPEYKGPADLPSDRHMKDWWLRSSETEFEKYYVTSEGKVKSDYANKGNGIRPALWVKTSFIKKLLADKAEDPVEPSLENSGS